MTTMKGWYERVNAAWPAEVPGLTDWEAVRAASRLYRWARGHTCRLEIRATSGNRRTWAGFDRARNRVLWVNPDQGWKRFIHDLSHYVDMEPENHSKHHARLELRMINEVVKRGWLDGRLKQDEADKLEPNPIDVKAIKLQRTEAAIARWEAKLKRAQNALKKLGHRQRYYHKAVSAQASMTMH